MTETFDELKDKLLDKVEKELTEYEAELLIKSPKDILDGAYKYHICYDILTEIENMNEYEISKEKIGALLSTDNALDRIYTHWGNTETSYMDEIRKLKEQISGLSNYNTRTNEINNLKAQIMQMENMNQQKQMQINQLKQNTQIASMEKKEEKK